MRVLFFKVVIFLTMLCSVSSIYGQEQEQKSPQEMASIEADRLQELLDLEIHQVFYADSILRYNMEHLFKEFKSLREGGMQDSDVYKTVQDRWLDKTILAFEKILSREQYVKYMKSIGKGKLVKKKKKGKK